MKTSQIIVYAAIALQIALLIVLSQGTFDTRSSMLDGLVETRKKAGETKERPSQAQPSRDPAALLRKYVEEVEPKAAAFTRRSDYQTLTPERKRIKLLEFFNLQVADIDYSMLPEDEQKKILEAFLKRYQN